MPELRNSERLAGVHPDLVRVVRRAVQSMPFDVSVIEGMRTIETQRRYVASGASKTMNSRHLTGHAVDLAPMIDGKVSWHWPQYFKLAPIMKQAAKDEGVLIEWGGDWRSFKDGPHWQLPFAQYPKGQPHSATLAPAAGGTQAQITVERGDSGPAVARVQRILGLTADGIFGTRTANAVKAFQASKGLTADGVVGPRTWAEILKQASQ